MANTLIALYDDAAQVKNMLHELDGLGLSDADIRVAGGHAGIDQRFTGDPMALMTDAKVPQHEADFYHEAVRRGSTLVAARVPERDVERVSRLMSGYGVVPFEDRYADYEARGYRYDASASQRLSDDEMRTERERYARGEMAPGSEEIRAKLVEERLNVGKRAVEGGGARLSTYVTTDRVQDTVTLREERVHVEQVETGERRATEADLADAFEERTIEMRERREEAVVSKEAFVTGEVVMNKEAGTREETVGADLRRTNVDVEQLTSTGTTGATELVNTLTASTTGGRTTGGAYDDTDFRSHYQSTYGSTGRAYDTYAPAYRYGYEGASRYDGDWDAFERDMQSDYERTHSGSMWSDVKDAVKTGFQKTRNAVTGGADGNRATQR